MYGLYKHQKKYVVKTRNIRNKKKLIVQHDDREMLDEVARNLNLRIPIIQLSKNIGNDEHFVDNNKYIPECILGITNSENNNFWRLSTENINFNELVKQKDTTTLHENVTEDLRNESSDNILERSLYLDIIDQSETIINNNYNLDFNINSSLSFSFEELNLLNIESSSYQNIKENGMISNNNVPDKCYSITDSNNVKDNNNIEDRHNIDNTENEDNVDSTDNRDTVNNNINRIHINDNDNIIDDIESYNINEKNAEQLRKVHFSVDNSTCNSDYNSTDTDNSDDKDSDYCYNEDSETSDERNDTFVQEYSTECNNTTQSSLETSLNVSGQKICDDVNLRVECSKPKGIGKQNFCYYCKKMQSKISRHLERVHKDEEEVKKFALLPKGNKEREKIIGLLRRKGNYLFNTNPMYNKGELIVCRRPTESKNRIACDFICCAGCKGFFTKNNIRHHFKQCTQKTVGRSVKVLGRKVQGRIHECANSILRNIVFPVLREDDVIRLIRYDELLITYGNKLCVKYKHQHQQDMIRSRLRLLGRFLQALRKINKNVTDFYSLYHPSIYDDCIAAVNQVAGLNTSTKIYTAPSVASRLGTLLKQIGNLSIAECIKRNRFQEKTNIENFLKLLQEDFSVSVNKTVEESILQAKRYQLQELPSLDDIKLLHNFLLTNRRLAFQRLRDEFTYNNWRQLAQFTLISVQVFNRRRAGEIERISIDDYKHQEGINEQTNPDLYESLSDEARKIAKNYTRFLIRGKLGRSVPVLLDCEMKNCIDLLIQYRTEARIPQKNPYVFALPAYDKKRFRYLRACDLLRTYSIECGASMPLRLRGTKLRKHIATRCITLNLSEPDVTQLASYLGHDKSIHMQHYRQPIPQIEIVKMSRLLKIAQGEIDNIERDIEEDNPQINAEKNSPIIDVTLQLENDNRNYSDDSDTTTICNAVENTHKRKRRSTSPYGSTKRVRWTQEESDTIMTSFKQEIKERRLPSGKLILEIKMRNKCLSRRSIPQIRSWIHNQIFKKSYSIKK